MNYLVTGGTGFIGSAVIQSLLADGRGVAVLTRDSKRARKILGPGVTYLTHLSQWSKSAGPDVVINLVGMPILDRFWTQKRKRQLRESRIFHTQELVNWLKTCSTPPQVLISASAVGYYGCEHGTELLDESSPRGQDFAAELCFDWEQSACEAETFTRLCVLRLGVVLGPGGGMLKRMLWPFRLGLGGRLASGKQIMSWVHKEDVIAVIKMLIADPEAHGVYNCTAPRAVTNADFTQILAKCLHRPALLPIPGWILRLLLGEAAKLLTCGQNAYPKRLLESGFTFQYTNVSQALAHILCA